MLTFTLFVLVNFIKTNCNLPVHVSLVVLGQLWKSMRVSVYDVRDAGRR